MLGSTIIETPKAFDLIVGYDDNKKVYLQRNSFNYSVKKTLVNTNVFYFVY
ncbi:hypothetical protein AP058_01737 [Flavobacterium sp. TAB 87]|nr:hypothetical protein AP058_01737 [Flavobacterium sp. TAB 87]